MSRKPSFVLIFSLGLAWCSIVHAETVITGAGSSFVAPMLTGWNNKNNINLGVTLKYQSVGSGAGIKQIKDKAVDFGATDKPLDTAELIQAGLVQFPVVMGGVVPVYNVPGIKAGELKLSGTALADIFLGKITSWDDAVLRDLNPGLRLPKENITTVSRSESSGTTYVFTHYLSAVSKEFKEKIGSSTTPAWKTGANVAGNDGVSTKVRSQSGAIGYVESSYMLQHKLHYVQLRNREGQFVKPFYDNIKAAAEGAKWDATQGFNLMLTNQGGANSWPIVGTTFVLAQKQQQNAVTAKAMLTYFESLYKDGRVMAVQKDYVPMPESTVKLIKDGWKNEIKDNSGKAIWAGG